MATAARPLYLAADWESLNSRATHLPFIDKKKHVAGYNKLSHDLFQKGKDALTEGDLESAYVFLLKYVTWMVEKMPQHPHFKRDFADSSRLSSAISMLEKLKEVLKQMYKDREDQKKQDIDNKRRLEEEQRLKLEQERLQWIQENEKLKKMLMQSQSHSNSHINNSNEGLSSVGWLEDFSSKYESVLGSKGGESENKHGLVQFADNKLDELFDAEFDDESQYFNVSSVNDVGNGNTTCEDLASLLAENGVEEFRAPSAPPEELCINHNFQIPSAPDFRSNSSFQAEKENLSIDIPADVSPLEFPSASVLLSSETSSIPSKLESSTAADHSTISSAPSEHVIIGNNINYLLDNYATAPVVQSAISTKNAPLVTDPHAKRDHDLYKELSSIQQNLCSTPSTHDIAPIATSPALKNVILNEISHAPVLSQVPNVAPSAPPIPADFISNAVAVPHNNPLLQNAISQPILFGNNDSLPVNPSAPLLVPQAIGINNQTPSAPPFFAPIAPNLNLLADPNPLKPTTSVQYVPGAVVDPQMRPQIPNLAGPIVGTAPMEPMAPMGNAVPSHLPLQNSSNGSQPLELVPAIAMNQNLQSMAFQPPNITQVTAPSENKQKIAGSIQPTQNPSSIPNPVSNTKRSANVQNVNKEVTKGKEDKTEQLASSGAKLASGVKRLSTEQIMNLPQCVISLPSGAQLGAVLPTPNSEPCLIIEENGTMVLVAVSTIPLSELEALAPVIPASPAENNAKEMKAPKETVDSRTKNTVTKQTDVSLSSSSSSSINGITSKRLPKYGVTHPPPTNKSGKKKLYVCGELFDKFMILAEPNTARSIETCGILAGISPKEGETMEITTVIIPEQKGTKDTCTTQDEDQLCSYLMEKDLVAYGWIHTHPSQECFLSSVDLHMQISYQTLLDSAIAVVIAPKFVPDFGIFALSKQGMEIVGSCRESGFHYHNSSLPLFEDADHVMITWGSKHNLVDLRR